MIASSIEASPSCFQRLKKIISESNLPIEKAPRLSVVVFIRREGKVLYGLRKSSQTWAPPGGGVEEFDQSFEEAGHRENAEETGGLKIKNLRVVAYQKVYVAERGREYYVGIAVADWESGEAIVAEPEKNLEWKWFTSSEMPEPMFAPNKMIIDGGFDPFSYD